jgi:hypothetical protein
MIGYEKLVSCRIIIVPFNC